jgi:hypothetical protein
MNEPPFAGRWLWLFPVTYAAHAVEEIWAGVGYAAWITALSGQPISSSLVAASRRRLGSGDRYRRDAGDLSAGAEPVSDSATMTG